jgi:ribulose kinase
LADPLLKGGIYGLALETTDLSELYEATIEGLAYEAKFIVEELKLSSMAAVLVSGGLLKNEMYMQIHADVLGVEVTGVDCGEIDMMLAGAAIMAKQAACQKELTLKETQDVSFAGLQLRVFQPTEEYARYHETKYKCYRKFVATCQEIKAMMSEVE